MQGQFDVGLDLGSVSVKLVVMNEQGEVLREAYEHPPLAIELADTLGRSVPLKTEPKIKEKPDGIELV